MPTFKDHEEDKIAKETLYFYVYFMLSSVRETGDLELQKDIARTDGEKLQRFLHDVIRTLKNKLVSNSYSSSKNRITVNP